MTIYDRSAPAEKSEDGKHKPGRRKSPHSEERLKHFAQLHALYPQHSLMVKRMLQEVERKTKNKDCSNCVVAPFINIENVGHNQSK